MSTENRGTGSGYPDSWNFIRSAVNNSPFYLHIGMRLVEFTPQGSRMELKVKPEHKNIWNTAHGGVLASLLDSACGLATVPLREGNETTVTQDLHIKYMAPLREGIITAYGQVVHKGKGSIMTEAEAFDESGVLVGKAYTTHRVHQPKKE
jgi:uncharacterized protein (TIGR00369 family)